MVKDWYGHEELVRSLYVDEQLSLAKVERELQNRVQFHASSSAILALLKKRGWYRIRRKTPATFSKVKCEVCLNDFEPTSWNRTWCPDCGGPTSAVRLRLRKFGICLKQYNEIVNLQGEKCALCGSTKRLAIDHDHKTFVIRGLLCANCNHAIQRIEEVPDWAERAIEYLKRPGWTPVRPSRAQKRERNDR